ncbi:MAG: hypothetical protein CSA76_01350 [Spirochaetales bacterium]|nr:MAG: hypothetical protein CSA76_01350 [Spirochaetales bacterium]
MASYYYLAASMPMLTGPEQAPPLTSIQFLDTCRRFMPDKQYLGLAAAALKPENSAGSDEEAVPYPPLYQNYYMWECSLRNELVKLRASEQSLSADVYLRDGDDMFGTAAVAAEAVSKATPLEAELFLNAARWQLIEELSAGHFFDMEFLTAYRLQLQLLERHAMFEEEKGFAAYRSIYERVLEASGTQFPVGGENV